MLIKSRFLDACILGFIVLSTYNPTLGMIWKGLFFMIIKQGKRIGNSYFLRFLKEVARIDRLSIIITIAYAFVVSIADIITTYLPKVFVDGILDKNVVLARRAVAAFLSVIVFYNIVAVICAVILSDRKEKRRMFFVERLFSHTFCVKQEYVEGTQFYNEYSMREANLEKAVDHVMGSFSTLVQQAATVLFIISAVSRINLFIGLIMVVPILINLMISLYVNGLNIEEQKEKQRYDKKLKVLSRIFYLSNSIRDIKMLGMVRPVMGQLDDTFEQRLKIHNRYMRKSSRLLCISSVITEALPLVSMVVFGYYVFTGRISISAYYVYIAFYAKLKLSIEGLLALFPEINNISLWMKDYYDYIDNQDIVEKNPEPGAGIGTIDTIEFRHVSFQYENSGQYALKDISFRLEKNSKNVIIGLNGAGKSTLLKLLCGVYEPSSGEVLLNGRDMRELPREDVRRLMSVLFQDYYIFPFTIRENVTAFEEGMEMERRMEQLAERFGILEKIRKLNKGFDTGIKAEYHDDYTDMSGGEFQKLAIMRAFCRPDVDAVLLDEPLNNIDIATEDVFYEFLAQTNDKTIILISHSLKYVPRADKIIYVEAGSIVAEGRHDELLKGSEKYRNLYQKYAEKYMGEEGTNASI